MSGRLHYISKGAGTAVLFQHGLGANSTQITALLGSLTGAHLISIDCPGHGQSILPQGYFPSFDTYSKTIIDQIDELNHKKLIAGGLSMGSGIALNIALSRPDLIKGLILLRPAWLDKPSPDNLHILLQAADFIKKENGGKLFKNEETYRDIQERLPLAAQSMMGVFSPSQQARMPYVLKKMIADYPIPDLKVLQSINVPCLILANEDDPLHPYNIAEKLSKSIRNSILIKITSRYISDIKHQAQVRNHIQEFIEKNA